MAAVKRGRLAIESLESKQMLAGDVLVSVANGALSIQGDELGNQIAIASGDAPGAFVIQGLGGTTVRMADASTAPDAAPIQAVVVEGVTGDVRVAMGDGDDVVQIDDAAFRGSVAIATGDGADRVAIGVPRPDEPGPLPLDGQDASVVEGPSVQVGRSLRVATGDGEDTVLVQSTRVGGGLAVATGADADTVRLGAPEPPLTDPTIVDETTIEEAGRDFDVTARRAINVHLGSGEDELVANRVATRALRASGGADADGLRLIDVAAQTIALSGGRGDAADEVFASGVRAGVLGVATGGGADEVRLVDSAFARLGVGLGEGDDVLAISGVTARVATLSGGAGEADRFRDGGENRFGRSRVGGFESPAEDPAEEEAAD